MNRIDPIGDAPAGKRIVAEFPCTQTQLRCWFLDQLSPGNPALNVAVRWEIRGVFKSASLEQAFQQVIDRHEILRTCFRDVAGQPVQQVVDRIDFKMPVIDLRNVPPGQREERIQSISRETARAPFDLRVPGLFRVTLLMVENHRGLLLITAHQCCFDGWSIRVLGREVGEIAAAIDAGRPPVLPELPLQYGDYALWQSEYRKSYGFEAEKEYWRRQLADAPYFEVRPDRPRGRTKTSRGEIIGADMPLEFSERIDKAARAHQVSLFSYGAAVMSTVLHRISGEREILFGTQIAGREDVDLENLIGVFINNLVLRFDVAEELTFAEHIARTSETVTGALNHQKMPFNNLVELINPARDPSRNPLVSINFNQQKAFLENARYGTFELISSPSQSPGVIYDLNFIMIGRPTGWRMSVEYNTDLFDQSTAQEFLRLWQDTYEHALADPSASLGSLGRAARRARSNEPTQSQLASLESRLTAHPDVAEAAAIRAEGGIHAFVVPSPHLARPLETLPAYLMEHLAARLEPGDMPARISVLLALPRDASGAIDRHALQAPAPAASPKEGRATVTSSQTLLKPASEQEQRLAGIWAEVLGVSKVEGSDDFFALGGHSLLALRMLSAMKATFGVKPDLALLFRAPTLAAFAREVFGEEAAAPAPAVPVETSQPAARAKPTYWETSIYREGKSGACTVYTLNHPFLYYRMARELDDGPAVVNLHMFGADVGGLGKLSLEEIVADAIEAMDLGSDPGPIAIVGLCVNGVLAMELARQIRRLGHPIRFVAAIDSWAPGYFRSLPRLTQLRWNTEKRIKRVLYFTGKLLRRRIPLIEFLKEFNITQKMLGAKGVMNDEEQQNALVTEFLVQASRRYTPKPLMGEDVILFRSRATHKQARRLLFGWRGFIRDDTPVYDLEGWHEDSLTSAGISKMASILSRRLNTGGASAD